MSQAVIPGKMVKIKTSGGIYPIMELEVFRPPYKAPKDAPSSGVTNSSSHKQPHAKK